MLATSNKGCRFRCRDLSHDTSWRQPYHLSLWLKEESSISRVVKGCQDSKVLRVASIKPHAPPACGSPSIRRVSALRSLLSPGGCLMELTAAGGNLQHLALIVYGVVYQRYLITYHAFEPQRQLQTRVAFATGVPPYICTHFTAAWIPLPLLHSSSPVSSWPLRLSRGLSHQAGAACASLAYKSDNAPPTYAAAGVVSRGFLVVTVRAPQRLL